MFVYQPLRAVTGPLWLPLLVPSTEQASVVSPFMGEEQFLPDVSRGSRQESRVTA